MLQGQPGHRHCYDGRQMIALLRGFFGLLGFCSETRLQSLTRGTESTSALSGEERKKGFSHVGLIRAHLNVLYAAACHHAHTHTGTNANTAELILEVLFKVLAHVCPR